MSEERPRYTREDVERVFNQPIEEVHRRLTEQAAAQRPAVERAIASLTRPPN